VGWKKRQLRLIHTLAVFLLTITGIATPQPASAEYLPVVDEPPLYLEAVLNPASDAKPAQIEELDTEPTRDELIAYIMQESGKYGVSGHKVIEVIRCESNFDSNAVGDNGNSRGIAQIHRPSWPDITDEQAFNPLWSIDWTIEMWREGKQELWTCYNILYG